MVDSISGINEQKYKHPGFWACAGGTVAGLFAMGVPIAIAHNAILPKLEKSFDESSKVSSDEFVQINKATEQVLQDSGLAAKGVSILRYSPETAEEIAEVFKKENPILSKIKSKFLRAALGLPSVDELKTGGNGFYTPIAKKILIPEKALPLTIFHEMGHAGIYSSMTGKVLEKTGYLAVLSLPILLISLLKTKKAPNEKPVGIIDKTTDFIKNNAGKLTFVLGGTGLLTLINEGLASIKGVGYAKKVLDPTLVQKFSKSSKFAFLTYLTAAVAGSVGVALAVKVKDAIAKPKRINENKS